MLKLQKYFKEGGSLEELQKDPYNLQIMVDKPYTIFKYNMIESDLSNPIVQESRGVILDEFNNVVCISFNKFFNYGESEVYDIDLSKATVFRKYDGSLIKIWYSDYYDTWLISTNGTINAFNAGLSHKLDWKETFGDLVMDTLGGVSGFKYLTNLLEVGNTYSFELLHPQNPIVEEHTDKSLVLIGVRNNKTLEEYDIRNKEFKIISSATNVSIAKTFDVDKTSFETLLEEASGYNDDDNIFEGFVVADIKNGLVHGRVKLKTPMYLKFHRLTDREHSDNVFVEVFLENEMSEFESYIDQAPSYAKERYYELKDMYNDLLGNIENEVSDWKAYLKQLMESDPDTYKREFGMEVQKRVPQWKQGFIFEYVYKGTTPKEYLSSMHRNKLKKILGI